MFQRKIYISSRWDLGELCYGFHQHLVLTGQSLGFKVFGIRNRIIFSSTLGVNGFYHYRIGQRYHPWNGLWLHGCIGHRGSKLHYSWNRYCVSTISQPVERRTKARDERFAAAITSPLYKTLLDSTLILCDFDIADIVMIIFAAFLPHL